MKKILILLLSISMLFASTAFAKKLAAKNQLVREAALMYEDATYDRHANWQELEPVMQKITLAQQQKLDASDQRTAALLLVNILRYQYSLLESPKFDNTRGGWPLLQKAKKIANDWLAQHPRDIDMLHELYTVQITMRENKWPTLRRILALEPRSPYPQILLALLYQHEKQEAKAMQPYAKAVRWEKNPKQTLIWMGNALSLSQDAGCHFPQELKDRIANSPIHQFYEHDEKVKKSPAYKQALRDTEKIKQEFLRVYHYKNCVKDAP